jgi:hypothetical protein
MADSVNDPQVADVRNRGMLCVKDEGGLHYEGCHDEIRAD